MNKALVVTGASSDMGTALIKQIGGVYSLIVVQYRHMNTSLRAVLDDLAAQEVTIKEIEIDLAAEESADVLKGAIKELSEDLSGMEIHFVHFPAIAQEINRFHKIEWDKFQENINVSVRSFVVMAEALLPKMIKTKGKILAMISWVVENIPPRYCSDYVMTKYALLGLVKAMAAEYAERGVTVNGVSPAWVETKYVNNLPDIVKNNHVETSPIHRCMEVGEIVPTMEFLLSAGADMITGECISITGGRITVE